jgi:iron complex transport system permease protein
MESERTTGSRLRSIFDLIRGRDCDGSDGVIGTFNASKRKKIILIIGLATLLVVVALIALGVGAVDVPIGDTIKVLGNYFFPDWIDAPAEEYYSTIILRSRVPRVLLAVVTGISLAMSGVVMQGLLRNPLVSPFTLGLSSAASFGAAMALVLGPLLLGGAYLGSFTFLGESIANKNLLIILMAFISGMSSIVLVLAIARTHHLSQSVLVLSGVVINYLFSAGISFMKYVSEDNTLREITNWLMGGMWGATWSSVLILVPIVIACFILMERCTVDLNTLSGGDDVARNLGVNVRRLRNYGLTISAFVTSACLAFTGVIGFIGLMAPHICKMVIGNDHRYLLPASALLGALILLLSDTVARTILRPVELPVGIIMYLIGGLFFIWLVTRKTGRYLA